MKKFKIKSNERMKISGITLVALIVTIVILLILAGITIMQLNNNGLLKNTKLAKEKYTNSQKEENSVIDDYSNQIDNYEVAGNRRDTITISKEDYQLLKSLFSKNTDQPTVNMMKPNNWQVGVEYNFGDSLYGQRFTGTITINAHTYSSVNLSNDKSINNIISYGGAWTARQTNGNVLILNANEYDGNQESRVVLYPESDGMVLWSKSASSRTNAPYDIWVLYTKSK